MLHIKLRGRLVMHIPLSSIPWVGCGGGGVFFKLVGDSSIAYQYDNTKFTNSIEPSHQGLHYLPC